MKEKNCAVVVRVSDSRQAQNEKNSLELQIDEIRKWIELKNINPDDVVYREHRVYDLKGVSGSKSFKSKEFEDLQADISLGRVQVVMCTALDRLGRDVKGFLEFFDECRKNKAELVCTRLSLDTGTPTGEAMVTIMMALAKLELDIKTERNRRGSEERARGGLFNGGHPVLGYDLNPDPTIAGRLVVNEKEAVIVKRAFEEYLKLGSDNAVAALLSGEGYKNKRWKCRSTGKMTGGGPITDAVVKTMLTNVTYVALRKCKQNDPATNAVIDELSPGRWDAIIDRKTFDKVQEARKYSASKKGHVRHRKENHFYLLRDVAVCSFCGEKMSTGSGTSRQGTVYFYYICNNKSCEHYIDKDTTNRVDPIVADRAAYAAIGKVVSSEESVAELTALLNKRLTEAQPRLAGEMKNITQTMRERKNEFVELSTSLNTFEPGTGTHTHIKKEMESKFQAISLMEKRIAELKSELILVRERRISKEQVLVAVSKMQGIAEHGTDKQKRDVVRFLFSQVLMSKEQLEFKLKTEAVSIFIDLLTRNGGFELRANWRLVKDLNLRPSG